LFTTYTASLVSAAVAGVADRPGEITANASNTTKHRLGKRAGTPHELVCAVIGSFLPV
jgi:hypothetical protein